MDTALRNALKDLKHTSPIGLPSLSDVESAKNNTQWSGKQKDGGKWSLTKNAAGSYNCEFGTE